MTGKFEILANSKTRSDNDIKSNGNKKGTITFEENNFRARELDNCQRIKKIEIETL